MLWTEIKRWAKEKGYVSFREKTTHENNPNDYDYYWGKEDDPLLVAFLTVYQNWLLIYTTI